MSAPDAAVTGLCFRCGGPVAPDQVSCPYCGMPVILPPPGLPPTSAPVLAPVPAMLTAPPLVAPPMVAPPMVAPSLVASPLVEPGGLSAPGAPGGLSPIMTAGPQLTSGPPERRRLGVRPLLAIGLVVLLLVGAGVAAVTLRLTRPGPASTVSDYFSALSGGHAARALRYVSSSTQFTPDRYPLLSEAGLMESSARPSAVHVGAVAPIPDAPAGIDASSVKVSFHAGVSAVQENLVVLRHDGDYLIQSPFIQVAVGNAAGRKVTVNGIALGDQQLNTLAFPGDYHAVAAADQLLGGSQGTSVLRPGAALPLASIDLGTPALAPGALAEIQTQVRAVIDGCAGAGQVLQQGCPFGLNVPGTPTAVRWTVSAYPTVGAQVTQSLFGLVVAVTGPGGRVHWDVSYTGVAGDKRHETGDSDFAVNGSATLTASGIQVSLAG